MKGVQHSHFKRLFFFFLGTFFASMFLYVCDTVHYVETIHIEC